MQVTTLSCPSCGQPVNLGENVCEAGHPVYITSFSALQSAPLPIVNQCMQAYQKSVEEDPDNPNFHMSLGFCFLQRRLYGKALAEFEAAMLEIFDNSELYFYAAVCLLEGKKAFLHQRPTINRVLEYMNAAMMIEPRGIYSYFVAYIKYDYFKRKFLNVTPDYAADLAAARTQGVSGVDADGLFALLGVERPAGF